MDQSDPVVPSVLGWGGTFTGISCWSSKGTDNVCEGFQDQPKKDSLKATEVCEEEASVWPALLVHVSHRVDLTCVPVLFSLFLSRR